MSEGTEEGSARRASDFQIFDSSSEGEQSDIPVREIIEESPYEQSENSSSVGAAAAIDEGAPITVEAIQDGVTRQEETTPADRSTSQEETVLPEEESPERSIEVVELDRTSSLPRKGSGSSTDGESSG